MFFARVLIRVLDLAGSVLIREKKSSIKPPDELPSDRSPGFEQKELSVRLVPATIVAFIIFAPVCVATGGTFQQCSDLFLKIGV